MTAPGKYAPLSLRFLRSAVAFPERPALEVAGVTLTYNELHRRALGIARLLLERDPGSGGPQLSAVFASRSVEAFAAVLGILLRGHGYVPLNPRFPVLRNRDMLQRAGCRVVVVDPQHLDAAASWRRSCRSRQSCWCRPARNRTGGRPSLGVPETPAYLLFTSGSTGRPKGVLVRQANVVAFLDAVAARYDLNETDRLSQLFDLRSTSPHSTYSPWQNGACVCCPEAGQLLRPSEFVRESGVTVWFSVPSTAMFLERLGGLKPGMFPVCG